MEKVNIKIIKVIMLILGLVIFFDAVASEKVKQRRKCIELSRISMMKKYRNLVVKKRKRIKRRDQRKLKIRKLKLARKALHNRR